MSSLLLARAALRAPYETRLARADRRVIAARRDRQLCSMVQFAATSVPFWQQVFASTDLDPGDVRGLTDMSALPMCDRDQVGVDPDAFRSSRAAGADSTLQGSGGSTGIPVRVYQDRASTMRSFAPRLRFDSVTTAAGAGSRPRRYVIANPDSVSSRRRALFRRGLVGRVAGGGRFKSGSNFTSLAEHIEVINAFRPQILKAFGSVLEALFEHADRTDTLVHRPRLAVFSADALSDSGRRLLEHRFGIESFGYYGAAEAPHIGFECEAHLGFHINEDLFPVRVVDHRGDDLGPGEEGEVVISNLVFRDTVLLNYRLGDRAQWLEGPCPCGRGLPLLSFITGRVEEWLLGPDGEVVHPEALTTLVRNQPGIRRFQFRQRSLSRIELSVVGEPADRDGLERTLREGVEQRIAPGVELEIKLVEELARTSGGKVKGVISDLTGTRDVARARSARPPAPGL